MEAVPPPISHPSFATPDVCLTETKPATAPTLRRFGKTEGPDHLGEVLPEIWTAIFGKGSPYDFRGLQATSKWCHNLYWDYRSGYNFTGRELLELELLAIMSKCNPEATLEINLAYTKITDLGIYFLTALNLNRLSVLSLDGTFISDESLEFIGLSFPTLKSLSLRCCPITDDGIAHLTSLPRLAALSVEDCKKTTESSLASFGQMTDLTFLAISTSPKQLLALDRGRGVQVHAQNLEDLRVILHDCGFSAFSRLTKLETFDSGPFMTMTPLAIETIARLSTLRYLRLHQSQLLGQNSINLISQLPELVELHIYKCKFVEDFSVLAQLSKVTSLALRRCRIRDSDLLGLSHSSPSFVLSYSDQHSRSSRLWCASMFPNAPRSQTVAWEPF